MTEKTAVTLADRLVRMRFPPAHAGAEYYAITLTAPADGYSTYSIDSHWVGWHGEGHRIEVRQGSLVTIEYAKAWEELNQPYVFVKEPDDVIVFVLLGGNALVERAIAERSFAKLIGPRPCYPHGRGGFIGEASLGKSALRRAPTPKLRMAVIKRDKGRCRICGRRPDDYVDVVLHVHHIRPWERGGITDASNLITLCHTCHTGLDPHFDQGLFNYVEQPDALSSIEKFEEQVARHRRRIADREASMSRKPAT